MGFNVKDITFWERDLMKWQLKKKQFLEWQPCHSFEMVFCSSSPIYLISWLVDLAECTSLFNKKNWLNFNKITQLNDEALLVQLTPKISTIWIPEKSVTQIPTASEGNRKNNSWIWYNFLDKCNHTIIMYTYNSAIPCNDIIACWFVLELKRREAHRGL